MAKRVRCRPSACCNIQIRDSRVKAFADSAAVGSAAIVNRMGNDFTLAKMFGRSFETDSINVDMIAVQGNKATMDSVMAALNAGTSIPEIGNKFAGVQGAQDSLWISMLDPQIVQYKETMLNAPVGRFFNPDTTATANGGYIFRVKQRRAAVPVVDMAVINYTIEPSNATVNTLEAGLNKFITENTTAQAFADNAAKAGYQVFPATVSASTPMITGMEDTRSVIAWAMDAKKGKVSPIFGDEQTGRFVVAALNDIYDDYTPARDPQVKTMLTSKVRNDKKPRLSLSSTRAKPTTLPATPLSWQCPLTAPRLHSVRSTPSTMALPVLKWQVALPQHPKAKWLAPCRVPTV